MENELPVKIDPKIIDAILVERGKDEREVAKRIATQFGQFVSPAIVRRVFTSDERRRNIERAKGQASSELGDNFGLVRSMIGDLTDMFKDEILSPKQRIDAAGELRQYIKLAMDAAGIHDKENNILFVIGGEWDMGN